jgi:hypothetical protein
VPLSCNLGTLTSWNPLGHSRPVTGLLYPYYYYDIRTKKQWSCPEFWLIHDDGWTHTVYQTQMLWIQFNRAPADGRGLRPKHVERLTGNNKVLYKVSSRWNFFKIKIALTSYWRYVWGCRGIAQVILRHGTTLRSVISFTPWPFYFRCPLCRGWIGPRAGCDGFENKKKILLPLTG